MWDLMVFGRTVRAMRFAERWEAEAWAEGLPAQWLWAVVPAEGMDEGRCDKMPHGVPARTPRAYASLRA